MVKMEIKLEHVKVVRRRVKGAQARTEGVAERVYFYSVTPGLTPARIPYEFGTGAFKKYVDARNAKLLVGPAVPKGTFTDAADYWRGNDDRRMKPSRAWRNLSKSSQKSYGGYIDREILPRFGVFQISDLEPEAVAELLEDFVEHPRTGNAVLAVMSNLCQAAIENSSRFGLTSNPCRDIKRFGKKDGIKSRSKYWSWEQEDVFLPAVLEADDDVHLAYLLLAYTGQRPIDVMKMEIADYNGTSILVIQEKTGAKVKIKVHRDLKPHLDRRIAELRKRGIIGGAIFRNRYDRPMKVSTLSLRWNEAVEKIGFADDGLQRRDLRRTAVIRLSEAGCDVPLITSITGHSLVGARSILQDYFVRTEEMAATAITKLEDYADRRKGKE